ncbi:phosphatase PAP2 family protein [Actinophytocola xanthii]|uniref:phosphatase PAP2 family protein n=1 Tax=Actinophytocola xanthii TaxID=1912961 RepID=UPI000A8CF244|nr:phosphatase PAP2 family protein [Actinophytocola xanthii]
MLTEGLVVVLATMVAVLCWRARRDGPALARAALAPAAAAVAYLVSEAVKAGWQVERPCRALGEVATVVSCPAVGDWSFPSNHATVVGALAVGILWSTRRLGAAAVALALLAAASRVFVGAHYPHDVLAGLLLGAAVALPLPLLARAVTPLAQRVGSRS